MVLLTKGFSQKTHEKTVDLSPYTIEKNTSNPEELGSWRHATLDEFEILSNLPDSQSNKFLRNFQLFRQALEVVRPGPPNARANSTLILCNRASDFKKLIPEGNEKEDEIVSQFLQNCEQAIIVVDCETREINSSGAAVQNHNGQPYDRLTVEPRRGLYREFVHYQLPPESSPPPWLLEGISQIAMDIEFTEQSIRFGEIDARKGGNREGTGIGAGTTRGGIAQAFSQRAVAMGGANTRAHGSIGDRQFNIVLARQDLMPLEQFFAVAATDAEARNPLKHTIWAKQAYAFVHMCMFQFNGKLNDPMATFASRLSQEPLSETLFEECFGMSYAKMEKKLKSYIKRPNAKFHRIKLSEYSGLLANDVTFKEANPFEKARILGDALGISGRDEQALSTYYLANSADNKDPELIAAIGIAEMNRGQTERARDYLESAASLGSIRPTTWTALARLRFEEANRNASEDGKLSAEQMNYVLAPLLKTLSLKPTLPETFILIADAWSNSSVVPSPPYIDLLGKGISQFPTDTELTLHAARLFAQIGQEKSAKELVKLGLRFAKDDSQRIELESLL